MKLLIGIPTVDYIHFEFVKCLTALCKRLAQDGVDYDLYMCSSSLIYLMREEIATKAIEGDYTYILWFDADMVFPETVFYDLAKHGKPFVTAIYHSRRPPHKSVLFRTLDDADRFDGDYPDSLFEIAGCGFGCLLAETWVFREVKEKAGTCFLPMLQYGEDLAFCYRAKAFDIPLYADPALQIGHVGSRIIYPSDCKNNQV